MTDARNSQSASVVADKGPSIPRVSQTVFILATLDAAQFAWGAQAAVVVAQETSANVADIGQSVSVVANSDSDQIASIGQSVLIVACSEPKITIPLFPFQQGVFPTSPMYRV